MFFCRLGSHCDEPKRADVGVDVMEDGPFAPRCDAACCGLGLFTELTRYGVSVTGMAPVTGWGRGHASSRDARLTARSLSNSDLSTWRGGARLRDSLTTRHHHMGWSEGRKGYNGPRARFMRQDQAAVGVSS